MGIEVVRGRLLASCKHCLVVVVRGRLLASCKHCLVAKGRRLLANRNIAFIYTSAKKQ